LYYHLQTFSRRTFAKTMKTTSVVAAMAAASTTTLVDPSVAFSPPRPTTASPQSSAATTIATRTRLREQRADGSVNSNSNNDNSVNSRRNFLERLSESAAVAASAVAGMTTGAALQGLPRPANAAIKTGAANSFTGYVEQCIAQPKQNSIQQQQYAMRCNALRRVGAPTAISLFAWITSIPHETHTVFRSS
jgi:hypothetical protein